MIAVAQTGLALWYGVALIVGALFAERGLRWTCRITLVVELVLAIASWLAP